MLNVEIRNSLANIIRQNGKRIAQDPVGLQTLLRAEAAQYPREIGMIVNAARAGIPQDIEAAGPAIYDLRPRMVEKLQNEQAFPQDVAEWVVETWISALSVADATPAQPAAAEAAPPPAAAVPPPVAAAPPPPAQQAPPMASPPPPQQAPYAPPPPQQQYQQSYQHTYKPSSGGSGKMVAIIVAIVVVLGGLGVGAYFLFFKSKNPSPAVVTTTNGPGPSVDPNRLFGNNGGGPGGANGGGPGGDVGGANGGGPGGANGGGPGGANGGGPGGDTGGGGDVIVGTYHPDIEGAPNQPPIDGTLTINQDMTFTLVLNEKEPNGQTTNVQAQGQVQNGGNQVVLNSQQVTVNGTQGDPSKLTMSLVPQGGAGKLEFEGVFGTALQNQSPGGHFYWVK